MSAHDLLQEIKSAHSLKNDARLAKFLGISPGHVSKLRSEQSGINGDIILLAYDKAGFSIERIRELVAA